MTRDEYIIRANRYARFAAQSANLNLASPSVIHQDCAATEAEHAIFYRLGAIFGGAMPAVRIINANNERPEIFEAY